VITPYEFPKSIFRQHGGILRTAQAKRAGIYPSTLYAMKKAGIIDQISRGVFRLADLPPLGNLDLATVALRAPQGVICLISALDYHELTTQIPHMVYLAVSRTQNKVSRVPRIDYPPIRAFHFSGAVFTEGIETHKIDGVDVRIYNPAKTLADCFKYRNKIGQDIAIEALRLYREKKKFKINELLHFAEICRVERVMKPYIEAML